jgi:hypothetical protein
MNWAAFFLGCFVVGFALTMISFLAGSVHINLPLKWHMGPLAPHGGTHAGGPHAGGATDVPVVNFSTIVAFLAWFGGIGYLLTHFHPVKILIGLPVAVAGGLTGASIVFWFLAKLMSYDHSMNAADYDLIGVLGRVNIPIREGGTGEIVYSLAGTRRVSGARSEDGSLIEKGSEVVITRYERGIAYVRRWDDMAGELTTGSTLEARKDESGSSSRVQ